MQLVIIDDSSIPLYEQIVTQIKEMILKGTLDQGSPLPSIRMLAKEVRVSIITVKRAYEELEAAGFVETIPGKGTYVSFANKERLKEVQISQIEDQLEQIVSLAKQMGMSVEEIIERVELIYEEV